MAKVTSDNLGKLTKNAFVGGILAAVTACTAEEEYIISKELDDTSWRAVSIDGFSIPKEVNVTMNFGADSSVSGLAGCNTYMVKNFHTEGRIAFTQAATTRMLCPEPQMTTENLFLEALSRAHKFRHNNEGQLLIYGQDVAITLDPIN